MLIDTSPDSRRDVFHFGLVIATVLFGLSAPWSIAIAQMSIGLMAVLILIARMTRRPGPNPIPWTLLLVLVFLAAQVLSIPLGIHPGRSLSCLKGSWVLVFPFVFWFALRDHRVRAAGATALLIGGFTSAVYGVVQHFQGIDWIHDQRALENYGGGGFVSVGSLGSHLTYAGALLPIFFIACGRAFDSARSRNIRILTSIVAATIGTALVFSFTRSAWIGAAGGLLFFGISRGRKVALLSVLGIALTAALAAILEPALAARLQSIGEVTDTPRWRLWQTAWRIIADHPLTGAGLGSFKTLFETYKVPGEYMATVHPHSDPLNHFVEAGILGILAWFAIWIAFFRDTAGDSRHSVSLDAMRSGVFALLVAGIAQCYSTDEEVAQIWWFLAVLGLYESGLRTAGGRAPLRLLNKRFKTATLPWAARLFAPKGPSSLPLPGSPKRILVVRQDNRLGNLVLMTPFLRRLREAYPDATIGMVTGEAYAPLLAHWPWVDQWFVQPKRLHATQPWRFPGWIRELRKGDWEIAFEMSNHNTHSYYNCVLTLASGAPIRIGFEEPRNQGTLTHSVSAPDPNLPFSLAPLALLHALGAQASAAPLSLPLPKGSPAALDRLLGEVGPDYTVIHLGGRGAKAWPMDSWREFLPLACEDFRGTLVLVAGPGELDLEPGENLPDRVLVAPQLEIEDLGRLIAGADAYVGCDTGVMHYAAAVGTPVVALFFQSNPYQYAPLGSENAVVLLANPYGVEDSVWKMPIQTFSRAHLFVPGSGPVGRTDTGDPATGPEAVESVRAAFAQVLSARGSDMEPR